ncbi:MAG: CBS domain-containing protein [Deltaproteobacteria bacterium]|nr:CBS domain-containing protein [Deltaproteobacteria bacterium]
MGTVKELLRARRTQSVLTIPGDATVLEAARQMAQHELGAVVVAEGEVPVGLLTERDVLARVVAVERDAGATPVAAVMSRPVRTIRLGASIAEARRAMVAEGRRHLVVVREDGGLAGVLSMRDLLHHEVAEQKQTLGFLKDYFFDYYR